jgi:hypothetical protein
MVLLLRTALHSKDNSACQKQQRPALVFCFESRALGVQDENGLLLT